MSKRVAFTQIASIFSYIALYTLIVRWLVKYLKAKNNMLSKHQWLFASVTIDTQKDCMRSKINILFINIKMWENNIIEIFINRFPKILKKKWRGKMNNKKKKITTIFWNEGLLSLRLWEISMSTTLGVFWVKVVLTLYKSPFSYYDNKSLL